MRELTHCPICTALESTILYPSTLVSEISKDNIPNPYSAHYQIQQCLGCDLILSSPILDDEGVSALYRLYSEKNVSTGEEENVKKTMQLYYNLFKNHLPSKQRILDIGCDAGYLLEIAQKEGFAELYGIEPVPLPRSLAKRLPNSNITDTFYENTTYPDNYFDLITMIHVLDHLVVPELDLKKALKNLKPGGILMAVVHNVESFLGRVLKEKFPVFNLYHHFFFSKKTLRALFEKHGFEVINVKSTFNCYSLGFFAERAPFLSTKIKKIFVNFLKTLKILNLPVSIPVGNIGIVARKRYDRT